ncbi:MAG TPA: M28 family peptidase [Anaerolineales bacterium]
MAGIITQFDAQYAYEIVKTICREVGPGLPGSPQERERAAHIQRELESHLGAGNVAVEEFPVAPWAMLSALPLSALLLLIAAGLNISLGRFAGVPPGLTAAAALAFSILAPLPFTFLFILDYEWIDPLFKQKQSVNVIGALRRPGTGSVKRLLILGGHHDSASENTWLGYLGNLKRVLVPSGPPGEAAEDALLRVLGYAFLFATATWTFGFIVLIALSVIQLMGVITGNAGLVRSGTLGWVLLAYPILPASVFGLFFNRGRQNGGTVPGAADNLAASALGVAMCRFLVNNPAYIPPETEIRFISFGSEEAGLRGSRRYVARHLAELRRLDARLLNFEVVADPEIAILTSDVNGTVKNSPEMVTSVVAAAQRAGVPYRVNASSLGGGSDAGPFSQAGLKALTLLPFKSPQQMVTFYHQKWDRPEVLSIQPLYNVLKLALEWVRNCGE